MKNYTHIVLVVDRSGSMSSIKDDAQGGINEFVREQRELPGSCTFSLYEFDDHIVQIFGPKDIADFHGYLLKPRGSTAMLDAMGRAINETGQWLSGKRETERPEYVVFVTVTDGYENASREFTYEAINAMVTRQKNDYNWQFIFLAGDQDAVLTGQSLGIDFNTSYANVGASARAAYGATSQSVSNLRTDGTMTVAGNVDSEGNVS